MGVAESSTFGRYQLLRLVGVGGMAEVHLARQTGPQGYVKPCVIKRISPEFTQNKTFRALFLEEARLSALLTHPHIVQTFDFGEVDGVPYMALELVDGMNLAVLCRGLAKMERWIPMRAALEITIQVCEALWYAHNLTGLDGRSLHLVHRDVSPQNVLVSRHGGVKLADFGIARHDARMELTQGISAKGKPGYMAPEQAMGQSMDGRADLFAVGIVLTELISARRVIRNEPGAGVFGVPRRVRELCSLRTEASPELIELACALTALEPQDRPDNARAVVDRLRRIADQMPAKDGLQSFLDRVFSRYFPPEALPTAHLSEEASDRSFDRVEPDFAAGLVRSSEPARMPSDATALGPKTLVHDLELPPPPAADEDLSFGDEPAEPAAVEQPAAAFAGWPAALLEDGAPPRLQLPSLSKNTDPPPRVASRPPPAPMAPIPPPTPAAAVPAARAASAAPAVGVRPKWGENEIELDPDEGSTKPSAKDEPKLPRAVAAGRVEGKPRPLVLAAPTPIDIPPDAVAPEDVAPPPESPPARGRSTIAKPKDDKLVYKALGGVVLVALLLTTVFVVRANRRPEAPQTGRLIVTSNPPGATIAINGRPVGQVTPASLTDLPLEVPMKVSVTLAGWMTSRGEVQVEIPRVAAETTQNFEMESARAFRLETEPSGAAIALNFRELKLVTPADLPPIRRGETTTVTLALDGYMPKKLVLATTTASVTQLVLERAKKIDIVTYPPGAKVFVDDMELGISPQSGVSVPSASSFTLRFERPGFKRFRKTYSGKKVENGETIELTLQDLPLGSVPMSREDRELAKGLQRALARANSELFAAKSELRKAEADIDRMGRNPKISSVDPGARAQNRVESARVAVENAESAKDDAQGALDGFRENVLNKIPLGP